MVVRTGRRAFGGRSGLHGRFGFLRHDLRVQPGFACENPERRGSRSEGPLTSRSKTTRTSNESGAVWGVAPAQRSRCMNSSGDITRWVVPSRQGVPELEHHLPGGVNLYAFVGQSRAREATAQLLQRLAVVGTTTHGC